MHILIIPSWYPTQNNQLSGIFFKEQAEALAKKECIDVGCISLNESSPRYMFIDKKKLVDYYEQDINSVKTIGILYPIPNRFKSLRTFIRKIIFKILFRRYIKKYGKPDILHLHHFAYGDLVQWVVKTYNIPYIVTEHASGFSRNIYNDKELFYAKNIFLESKANLCVSNELKQLLESKFCINFEYLPNSVDTDFFKMGNRVDKRGKQEKLNFINIAFMNKNKNQKLLIEAFAKAFECHKNVYLTIVGNGIEYESLDALIEKFNMQNQIKLYGVANRKEVLELLQSSDAFVLSSKHETFGVVLIEAMSCGLPVISTKSGGPESIIVDDKIGILVDNNIDSLVSGLVKTYDTDYNNVYIRNYVIQEFSSETISKKLIEIYEEIVKEHNNLLEKR